MIHQRINSILDRLYFRGNSQSVRTILKPDNALRANIQIMSKADNYNKYNYNQGLGKKHTEQR